MRLNIGHHLRDEMTLYPTHHRPRGSGTLFHITVGHNDYHRSHLILCYKAIHNLRNVSHDKPRILVPSLAMKQIQHGVFCFLSTVIAFRKVNVESPLVFCFADRGLIKHMLHPALGIQGAGHCKKYN